VAAAATNTRACWAQFADELMQHRQHRAQDRRLGRKLL